MKKILLFILFVTQLNAFAQLSLEFSHKRGFYDTPFQLTLSAVNGAEIRYTTDGSKPGVSSGNIYSGPIDITTTTPVRAIAYIIGTDTTKVKTHTFIFLEDVIEQPTNISGWPNNSYSTGPGTARHDYEMDPDVVNAPAYSGSVIKGMKDIPSMSIVMEKAEFWNMYEGSSEKEASIELIYAHDPSENEQTDCGIKAHSHNRLKRSMRLMFRKQYGDGNFDSDIFKNAPLNGDGATDEFDRIVLRGGNNRCWARDWNADRTAYTRDEWARASQVEVSGYGSRGTFVHLYVNGLYWGLFNPVERPDDHFTSAYFGGENEDWFAVSHGGNQGGDNNRWNYLMNTLTGRDLSQSSNYEELKEYLDIPGFADYLIIQWMTGVQDWPGNNWWGGNRNNPEGPFMFFGWDNEWSWDVTKNANEGAWVHPDFRKNDTDGKNSAKIWNAAKKNNDFMITFADRVYKNCFNNGPLTDENSRERWNILNDFIRDAMIGESARWGDALEDGITRTRDEHWQDEVDRMDGLMNGNVQRLITALRAEDYYPGITPPLYQNNSTNIEVQKMAVSAGYKVKLKNPNNSGTIYYTTDGSDPRLSGGAVAPGANTYNGETVSIDNPLLLLGRVKDGSEWSALHCLAFFVKQDLSDLKVTEIMYHPPVWQDVADTELEFIELKNTSTSQVLNLSGLRFVDGIDFEFPMGTTLAPQEFIVLASSKEMLLKKCPGLDIFGEYTGQLRNSGEWIKAATFGGDTVVAFEYDDQAPWSQLTDGLGYSLVPVSPNPSGDQNSADLWTISANNACGSPGTDDPGSLTGITESEDSQIKVYPNPNDGMFTVTWPTSVTSEESISIYNNIGQKVYHKAAPTHTNSLEVNISNWPSGIYLLIYKSNNTLYKAKIFKD